MSFDWHLDPATGDLPYSFEGVRKSDLVIQRIRTRLQTHLGEVWEDKRAGLPFSLWAQRKIPELDEVAAYIRREVEGIPGVLRVEGLASSVVEDAIVTELTVVSPTNAGFRVRIDLLSTTGAGLSDDAVVGEDGQPVTASPIVVVQLLDPYIGL